MKTITINMIPKIQNPCPGTEAKKFITIKFIVKKINVFNII